MSTPTYQQWRHQMIKLGFWGDQFTTPNDSVAHINHCRDQGLSLSDIATASNIALATLIRIADGTQKKLWQETEDKILTVDPTTILPSETPTFRARRRIEGLMSLGYPKPWIADQLGVTTAALDNILTEKFVHVRPKTMTPLRDLYDRIGDTPRTPTSMFERRSTTRTLRTARERGYALPACWDDIDDPNSRPTGMPREHGRGCERERCHQPQTFRGVCHTHQSNVKAIAA